MIDPLRQLVATGEVEIAMDAKEAGAQFAAMDEHSQAAFLVAMEEASREWDAPAVFQWHMIGRRLREDGESAAMDMLREIVAALDEEVEVSDD